jgi:hypothetical protein
LPLTERFNNLKLNYNFITKKSKTKNWTEEEIPCQRCKGQNKFSRMPASNYENLPATKNQIKKLEMQNDFKKFTKNSIYEIYN